MYSVAFLVLGWCVGRRAGGSNSSRCFDGRGNYVRNGLRAMVAKTMIFQSFCFEIDVQSVSPKAICTCI